MDDFGRNGIRGFWLTHMFCLILSTNPGLFPLGRTDGRHTATDRTNSLFIMLQQRTKRSRHLLGRLGCVLLLAVVVVVCGQDDATTNDGANSATSRPQPRHNVRRLQNRNSSYRNDTRNFVYICHRRNRGEYSRKQVLDYEVPSVIAVGGGRVGEQVPDMDGFIFDRNCQPTRSASCGTDTRTCGDGRTVRRDPDNGCAFYPCPRAHCCDANQRPQCNSWSLQEPKCCPTGTWCVFALLDSLCVLFSFSLHGVSLPTGHAPACLDRTIVVRNWATFVLILVPCVPPLGRPRSWLRGQRHPCRGPHHPLVVARAMDAAILMDAIVALVRVVPPDVPIGFVRRNHESNHGATNAMHHRRLLHPRHQLLCHLVTRVPVAFSMGAIPVPVMLMVRRSVPSGRVDRRNWARPNATCVVDRKLRPPLPL